MSLHHELHVWALTPLNLVLWVALQAERPPLLLLPQQDNVIGWGAYQVMDLVD